MASDNTHGRRGPRRIIELLAVLACAASMVMIGNTLAAADSGGSGGSRTTGATTTGNGNPTSNVNPAGHIRQRKCKKTFRGNRKHRKCRHHHRGKGTLHAPGQQK